ncbi:MAG: hypothetical protein Q4D44_00310 [Eubacteriales bacterium]|nr:hypothetical protein [Eubacteriales bacterium]
MNKKIWLSIILFCLGFIAAYLLMCFLPQFRIKLAAEPMEYFIESIRHNAFVKVIVSFVVGAVLAIIPQTIKKK